MTKSLETQKDKEELDKAIRSQKELLKNLESKAAREIPKVRERQLIQLYKEIEKAVAHTFATTKGFTLVLPAIHRTRYQGRNILCKEHPAHNWLACHKPAVWHRCITTPGWRFPRR